MTIHDDWDALGMRASGSHSVTFDGVELPARVLRGGFPAGRRTVAPPAERFGVGQPGKVLSRAGQLDSARVPGKCLEERFEPKRLTLDTSPQLDLRGTLFCDWRSGDVW